MPPPRLPLPLSGERRTLDGPFGSLAFYMAGPPAEASTHPPLLLVHSINAAASAAEVRPLFDHFRQDRAVYALDLPGYGHSDRSERPYTPRLMTDAVLGAAAEIHRGHARPLDVLGVSLGSEYVARAALEAPAVFRTAALISPTGFNRTRPFDGPPGSTRGRAWLLRLLTLRRRGAGLFRLLTRPGVIRYFLRRTWGRKEIDEALWKYCVLTTQQPGAPNAPFYFLSGFLFSADISRVYQSLTLPVFMAHGVRGDFVDYRYARAVQRKPNWIIRVFETGALPYFERLDAFARDYRFFLSAAQSSS